MKKFSSYVDKKVYSANEKIANLQNKTKELFFKCLNNGEDEEYFKRELDKIWDKVDYSFMQKDIEEYIEMIHTYNLEQANVKEEEIEKEVNKRENSTMYLVALGLIMTQLGRYKDTINRQYETSKNSMSYGIDKTEYLKKKVQRYNSQTVPYYSNGKVLREVKLSTYVAMIENTNLTRSGWNTTLNDADLLGNDKFYIPFHLFSCEHCREYQGRILTREEVETHLGIDEEQEGDILHPNCKCSLLMYWGGNVRINPDYSNEELEEQYNIRQKVNALTLKKSELLTDRRIYRDLNEQDEIDRVNSKIRSINTKIKDLQAQLPTEEMRKEVVAINR